MHTEFSFIEYSYDGSDEQFNKFNFLLTNLGYTHTATHVNGSVCVWQLNLNIIFLNECETLTQPKLTGLGFVCDQETINEMNAGYDDDTDMYVCHDPNGLRILMCPLNSFKSSGVLNDKYQIMHGSAWSDKENLLEYTSGVTIPYSDQVSEFYRNFGFKITKTGERFVNMVTTNNRFTLVMDNTNTDSNTLICDTNDIFYTTAYLASKIKLKTYANKTQDFGKMNFKINGYNCVAFGNQNSYSIENSATGVLPNLNLIFRQRKQYLHIDETTLLEHFDG